MSKEHNQVKPTREKFSVKNPNLCELEELKFVFSQAEKMMIETENTFNSNNNKSVTLLSFLVTICIGLSSYLFSKNDFAGDFSPSLFTIFILSISSFGLAIYSFLNIKTAEWNCSGSIPSQLFNSKFYELKSRKENYSVIKGMIYSEIINYETRIKLNLEKIKIKSIRINNSIFGLISLPVLGAICYLVSSYISNHL